MVDFWVYDVSFLILFSIWVIWFIKTRKKGISCEGRLFRIPLIFMYRTQVGVNIINWIGGKFKKTLNALKYVIITLGFALMGGIVWLLTYNFIRYVATPEMAEIVKGPPLAPLIPYFPKIFGMQSFFPDFYFVYFLIAIAIVMVVHEFSHGILMKLYGVKIKSTGILFFGPFLGAFVEQEDKSFVKKPKTEQMAILGAGVFSNVLTGIFFLIIWILMFNFLFVPAGYQFDSYAAVTIPVNMIDSLGEDLGSYNILPFGDLSVKRNLSEVNINGTVFLVESRGKEMLQENKSLLNTTLVLNAFIDAPAIRNQMRGRIIEADGVKIKSQEDLGNYMAMKNPGDEVNFVLKQDNGEDKEYLIELGIHPANSSLPFIGVSYRSGSGGTGFGAKIIQFVKDPSSSVTDPATHYEPIIFGGVINFIYFLVWWIVLINFLIALFNMLPGGPFDGGRFFYLTVLGITRSEKVSKFVSRLMGYAILMLFILFMYFYFVRLF